MVAIGEKIPDVNLVDTELKPTDLSKAIDGKPAIIAFFPGAFTSVCTAELCKFRDSMSEFNSLDGSVYAISVDGPFSNKAFKEKNGLNFTILSDYKREAVKLFGIELNNFANLSGYTAAKRSVFITDAKGIVRYVWISDNPATEPDYDEIKRELGSASKA